jgi:3-phosphoshikimate 1-carboxyvinyltransferase
MACRTPAPAGSSAQLLALPRLRPGSLVDAAVTVQGSKSVSNRALLLAAMAHGLSRVRGGQDSEDTHAMQTCLRALGFPVRAEAGAWSVEGGAEPLPAAVLPVGASGTTLRFLLPWLALRARGELRFAGDRRLFERPLGGLLAVLQELGARWEASPGEGRLWPAPRVPDRLEVTVDAAASSQFLTGLAMAAATLPGGGSLRWTAPPHSFSYLELSARWMGAFGCRTRLEGHGWEIPGGGLAPADVQVPGDWSSAAAYLCAAGAAGGSVRATPLDPQDPQGDRAIAEILAAAGCRVSWPDARTVQVEGPLRRGFEADLAACPDLGPVLAATAALAPGPSVLTGLQTLPLKECDRLEASAELVRWLGGTAEVIGDHTLRITPGACAEPRAPFDPRNDHRMAFAAAVGGLRCGGALRDPGCVAKTIPDFWRGWSELVSRTAPEGNPGDPGTDFDPNAAKAKETHG